MKAAPIAASLGIFLGAALWGSAPIARTGTEGIESRNTLHAALAQASTLVKRADAASLEQAQAIVAGLKTAAERGGPATRAEWAAALLLDARILTLRAEPKAAAAALDRVDGLIDATTESRAPLLQAESRAARGHLAILCGDGIAAARLYQAVLEQLRVRGIDDPAQLAAPMLGLAIGYQLSGRLDRARTVYERLVTRLVDSKNTPPVQLASVRVEFARLLAMEGRFTDSIEQARAAAADVETLSDAIFVRGIAASTEGHALRRAGRHREALASLERALPLIAAARGTDSPDLVPDLLDTALAALALGDARAARIAAERAVSILKEAAAIGTQLPVAESLSAQARSALGEEAAALTLARSAITHLADRRALATGATSGAALLEQRQVRRVYETFLELLPQPRWSQDSDTARVMQLILSGRAAQSLGQLADREHARNPELATLLRTRQDALETLAAAQTRLADAAVSRATSGDAELERMRLRRMQLERELDVVDQTLRRRYPEVLELVRPEAVPLQALQQVLRPSEMALLIVVTQKASFVIGVTRDAVHCARTALDAMSAARLATRLRASVEISERGPVQAFDSEAAWQLFAGTLEPLWPQLREHSELIIVSDELLHSVAFSTLLTQPAVTGSQRPQYLARTHAVTWAPGVSGFVALRQLAARQGAPEPFLGVGDPQLDGAANSTRGVGARFARELSEGIEPAKLRALGALPNTRAELRSMAGALGASEDSLVVGSRATESLLKTLPLERYRIVAFATHGIMAGEFRGLAEPGLVLTPPDSASSVDDGLLTASEIAALKLRADWVILSGCNTASGDGEGAAEGLAGLARAFFVAGARSLLVSHWYVETTAAERLTTDAVARLSRDPSLTQARALRLSMLALLDGPDSRFHHPALWGPYVVVGHGS